MKTKFNNQTLTVIIVVTIMTITYSFTEIKPFYQDTKEMIIGTWASYEDSNSKLIFSLNNICKQYYEGVLINTFTYSISNSSCGNGFDPEYQYLRLIKNSETTYCYVINGITKEDNDMYLSIEYVGRPRPMLFKKQ